MKMNYSCARTGKEKGFTLLELVIVLAIIAIILALLLPRLGESKCHTAVVSASATLKACQGTMSSILTSGTGSLSDILDCLKKAQESLDQLAADGWLDENTKTKLSPVLREANQLIDSLKAQVETEEDKAKLEAAKLKMP